VKPHVESYSIVVVGASWGGLSALTTLVTGLPADFALPIAVVQHRSKDAESLLGELLQDHTALKVTEADDKEPICSGHIYLAPADYHLLVDGDHFSLTTDPPVRYSRPSIDVTFVSAADSRGAATVGVVLTGANEDGAEGLRRIVAHGGYAVVQTPETAEIATMPRAALKAVPKATVLTMTEIAGHLATLPGASPAKSSAKSSAMPADAPRAR
jgi:two-component system, chemotaxis family, protein-glutamate methylesterase/glutaminase